MFLSNNVYLWIKGFVYAERHYLVSSMNTLGNTKVKQKKNAIITFWLKNYFWNALITITGLEKYSVQIALSVGYLFFKYSLCKLLC